MRNTVKKYGIDAPKVIRNLILIGTFALFVSTLSFFIKNQLWFWVTFSYTALIGLPMLITALLMLYSSIVLKPKILLEMLAELKLEGNEQLLDLGCGRGMFLIEAAKHLPKGKAFGVDLWRAVDQFGNSRAKTLKNIALENLDTKIEVHTADICSLPYPDNSLDVVVSSLTIHNISNPAKQQQALDELLRVLKPNGQFAIFDILSVRKYARYINSKSTITKDERIFYCPRGTLLMGRKNKNGTLPVLTRQA